MSEQVKDGGSAFPVIETTIEVDGQCDDYMSVPNVHSVGGMTLRDYFAAQIAPAYLAYIGSNCTGVLVSRSHKEIAEESYSIADEMLAAREAKS